MGCRFWRKCVLILVPLMTFFMTLSKAVTSPNLHTLYVNSNLLLWHQYFYCLHRTEWIVPILVLYIRVWTVLHSRGTLKVYLRRPQYRDYYNQFSRVKGHQRGLRKYPSTSESRALSISLGLKRWLNSCRILWRLVISTEEGYLARTVASVRDAAKPQWSGRKRPEE